MHALTVSLLSSLHVCEPLIAQRRQKKGKLTLYKQTADSTKQMLEQHFYLMHLTEGE